MKRLQIAALVTLCIAAAGAAGAGGAFLWLKSQPQPTTSLPPAPSQQVDYAPPGEVPMSFRVASERSRQSVVFIKTLSEVEYNSRSWLEWFYGNGSTRRAGSGSGVIYSENGFVITNNHVIDNADNIEVIHDGNTYKAELVGTDPNTDIALLKIEATKLPAIEVASSAELAVGDWVLAVGNPFNLTSTVTAGIVSAKSRNLGILKSTFPIESFIQTDAAINPGNSGGALVDVEGRLVGINTAILSRTGSYAGYGFAVPVDLVSKVVEDIIRYGEVQKPFFGAELADLNPALAERLGVGNTKGVVITQVQESGAAEAAGLEVGDKVLAIDGKTVQTKAEFEELLSLHSPGDKVSLMVARAQNARNVNVTLQNRDGGTGVLITQTFTSNTLGAEFERVSKVEQDLHSIEYGVKLTKIHSGYLRRLGIEEGFIFTSINDIPTKDPEETIRILEHLRGRVIIKGVSPNGRKGYYSFYL